MYHRIPIAPLPQTLDIIFVENDGPYPGDNAGGDRQSTLTSAKKYGLGKIRYQILFQ